MRLTTPAGAGPALDIEIEADAGLNLIVGDGRGPPRVYQTADRGQTHYLDLFHRLAADLGLRAPGAEPPPESRAPSGLRPLLTEAVAPGILYGYGDPCVVRIGPSDYRLLVTSNDAPDAFPILKSTDLATWSFSGFVFPQGKAPPWALTGPEVSDFWAPELHRVGAAWWVVFTARRADRSLAIGLAQAASPDGPFIAQPGPLVTGGVIDPHVLIDAAGAPWLIWKRDDNDVWPRLLNRLLRSQPQLADALFPERPDHRMARLMLTLQPWIESLEPMEQFFAQQPLIEAVASDLDGFEARLAKAAKDLPQAVAAAEEILEALRTRVIAQRISPDGAVLLGDPHVILRNDQVWEGHLIEGVWVTLEQGRYYLLYAGNDFSTARYGIGAAVADTATGPYRKTSAVLLGSDADWWGPGHPSVCVDDDGRHHVFLHGFRPGEAGYKAFRALLSTPVHFQEGLIELRHP